MYKILILAMVFLWGTNAYAGECTPSNEDYSAKDTVKYDFFLDSNITGTGVSNWMPQSATESENYYLSKNCPSKNPVYYSAVANSRLTYTTTDGDMTWYKIDSNPYFEVASSISVWNQKTGSKFFSVPFVQSNGCVGCQRGPVETGRNVRVKVKVVKDIVGKVNMQTPIASLYAFNESVAVGTRGSKALAQLILNITVISEETCSINKGDTLEFDFHNISIDRFNNVAVGDKPNEVPIQSLPFEIKCVINEDRDKLMRVRLQANKAGYDYIKSNNDNIGFKVASSDDNILKPNDNNSYFTFTLDQNNDATSLIKAWPVKTGTAPLTPGKVSANAFLRIDFN